MSVKQMSLPASGRDISIERPKILSSLGGGSRRVEEGKKLKFQNTSTPSIEAVHPSRGESKVTKRSLPPNISLQDLIGGT
jgi:hypothetical protein